MNRTAVLSALLALAFLGACQPSERASQGESPSFPDSPAEPFPYGVASGDPKPDALTFWTKATPEVATEPASVKLSYRATDGSEKGEATLTAYPESGFTVKTTVSGLKAGADYEYYFTCEGKNSVLGKAKTAPSPEAMPDSVKIAFVACSNYEAGRFNAYAAIAARDDLDAVVHLGDYIYEYGGGVYGDSTNGRRHRPDKEIVSLEDYRTRYAQYRMEPELARCHQNHAFIAIWDDHEIANNAHQSGAQNHQPETEGDFADRRAAAKQAYYEWLPVSDADPQLYRSFAFGKLLRLVMLEGRLVGRSEQGRDSAAIRSPDRSMLGAEQLAWMKEELAEGEAWKVLGNQVVFSEIALPFPSEDMWNGYLHERRQIMGFVRDSVENFAIVTGDFHSSLGMEVKDEGFAAYEPETGAGSVGAEFVVHSVTSANFDEYEPDGGRGTEKLRRRTAEMMAENPHVRHANIVDHGYFILTVTPESVIAEWHYMETIETPSTEELPPVRLVLKKGSRRLRTP